MKMNSANTFFKQQSPEGGFYETTYEFENSPQEYTLGSIDSLQIEASVSNMRVGTIVGTGYVVNWLVRSQVSAKPARMQTWFSPRWVLSNSASYYNMICDSSNDQEIVSSTSD